MKVHKRLLEKIDFTNYTLIIPSVAVGNVGQLTVDLLISSLSLQRIGSVINSAFIPIVGPDPYKEDSDEICTAIDIYISNNLKIVVFQIRSLLTKKPITFFKQLIKFIQEQSISKVIILTSSYDQEKRDLQIRTSPLRYIASETLILEYEQVFKNNGWLTFEKKVVDFVEDPKLEIPGGGFAVDLFEMFQSQNIPCAILIKFCSEGDNIPDSLSLLNYFNQLLKVIPEENKSLNITYPSSWKYLFGNSPPVEIY